MKEGEIATGTEIVEAITIDPVEATEEEATVVTVMTAMTIVVEMIATMMISEAVVAVMIVMMTEAVYLVEIAAVLPETFTLVGPEVAVALAVLLCTGTKAAVLLPAKTIIVVVDAMMTIAGADVPVVTKEIIVTEEEPEAVKGNIVVMHVAINRANFLSDAWTPPTRAIVLSTLLYNDLRLENKILQSPTK